MSNSYTNQQQGAVAAPDYNLVRSSRIRRERIENIRLAKAMRPAVGRLEVLVPRSKRDPEPVDLFARLHKKLCQCGKKGIARRTTSGDKYLLPMTCKSRICYICNSERSRLYRRKWKKYLLETHPELLCAYDPMHLTLTVPHKEGKFHGLEHYSRLLKQKFNKLRQGKMWKQYVKGGKMATEFTRNGENGLHIHIHALLFIHKSQGNRNALHKIILKEWNKLTMDPAQGRENFTDEQIDSICRGNSFIKFDWVKENLNPNGATMIGLENLYRLTSKPGKFSRPAGNGKFKTYVSPFIKSGVIENIDEVMHGVMEVMKYHFEPISLKKEDGTFNLELIAAVLPTLRNQRLSEAFGCFYYKDPIYHDYPKVEDATVDNAVSEELESVGETGAGEVIDKETGEILTPDDFQYLVVDIAKCYAGADKFHIPERVIQEALPRGTTLSQAILHVATRGRVAVKKEMSEIDET